MKKYYAGLAAIVLSLFMTSATAQNVAINTDGSLPDSSAILDIKSSNKGILIPRVSSAARLSITATKGLLVYDTTTSTFWYHTGSAWQNLAASSFGWSLAGNTGTDSTNFIGTTDNVPLTIKVNNILSGRLEPESGNAYWGIRAGLANKTGYGNTAIGSWTLVNNRNGINNTANGYQALYFDTSGSYNTAIGSGSLIRNTLGFDNTAVGYYSLGLNSVGNDNTAVGSDALKYNISGRFNTAIGSAADVSNGDLINATAIGAGAIVNASNKVRIGSSNVSVIEGAVPFTTPSDGRFKFNVQEDVKGLDFILQLRPVTYQFDVNRFDAQQRKDQGSGDVQWAASREAALIRRSGFIAQEVEKAANISGYNFSGLIKPKTAQEHYGLSYESFVVPLVKAVQELSETIIDLQNQLNELKQAPTASK